MTTLEYRPKKPEIHTLYSGRNFEIKTTEKDLYPRQFKPEEHPEIKATNGQTYSHPAGKSSLNRTRDGFYAI